MNDKKQIEEMAKDLKEEKLYALINKTSYMRSAENLYNLGYRKIDKDSVVMTREELRQALKDCIESNRITEERTRKRTAREILNYLQKDGYGGLDYLEVYREEIDEIAKQYGTDLGE